MPSYTGTTSHSLLAGGTASSTFSLVPLFDFDTKWVLSRGSGGCCRRRFGRCFRRRSWGRRRFGARFRGGRRGGRFVLRRRGRSGVCRFGSLRSCFARFDRRGRRGRGGRLFRFCSGVRLRGGGLVARWDGA